MFGAKHRNAAYRDLRKIDQALLDRLVEMGDDLSQPRHTLLFFYQPKDGSRASFEIVAAAATERSLIVTRHDQEGVIMEGHLHVDAASIKSLVDWAVDLASQASADFDGWECAVITAKH
ncbi:MAG: ribonuclease E inhibitor RraB [Hyphomonadaceae bacterium]